MIVIYSMSLVYLLCRPRPEHCTHALRKYDSNKQARVKPCVQNQLVRISVAVMRVGLITANCMFCCQCHYLTASLPCPSPSSPRRHRLVTFNNVYMNRMSKQVHTDNSWTNKGVSYLKSWGRNVPGRRYCYPRRIWEVTSSGWSRRSGSVARWTGRIRP